MLEKFNYFFAANNISNAKKRFLIGVSGGVDSVALVHLFHAAGIRFAIAHCNFMLRGNDSNEDENFVKQLAGKFGVEFFNVQFDTLQFSTSNKLSVQEAARKLRYDWFEKIRAEQKFDYIVTAHHHSDNIETIFLNLIRGTGVKGLRGMQPKRDKIIRPLLAFTKDEIVDYASSNQFEWREDASNEKDDYTRNFIRHNIVPLCKKVNPSFEKSFHQNIRAFSEAEMLLNNRLKKISGRLIYHIKGEVCLSINTLKKLTDAANMLFQILSPYGFNAAQIENILGGLANGSGRQFLSENFRVIQDRKFLIITQKATTDSNHIIVNENEKAVATKDFTLHITQVTHQNFSAGNTLTEVVDASKLQYPLLLRRWMPGDYFYPIGMGNKKKKIKKFLTDLKLPLHEKEKVWVLESDKKIVWVVGLRLDERFKINSSTTKPLQISLGLTPGQHT